MNIPTPYLRRHDSISGGGGGRHASVVSLGSRSVDSNNDPKLSPVPNVAGGSLDGSLASSVSVQSTGIPDELASAAEAEAQVSWFGKFTPTLPMSPSDYKDTQLLTPVA